MIPTNTRKPGMFLVLLLGTLIPSICVALSSDRNKPMHIEADRAELDDRKGISIYWGDVTVTRGTLRITADKITIHSKQRTITKVVAEGTPAHFQQRPDNQSQDVRADAERIEYYARTNQIVLVGGSKVWQASNVFQSDRIEYDIKKNVVNAGGEKSEITEQQRVHITIQPDHKSSEKSAEPKSQ